MDVLDVLLCRSSCGIMDEVELVMDETFPSISVHSELSKVCTAFSLQEETKPSCTI